MSDAVVDREIFDAIWDMHSADEARKKAFEGVRFLGDASRPKEDRIAGAVACFKAAYLLLAGPEPDELKSSTTATYRNEPYTLGELVNLATHFAVTFDKITVVSPSMVRVDMGNDFSFYASNLKEIQS